jgi:long-chain acyl-CoA synthetase
MMSKSLVAFSFLISILVDCSDAFAPSKTRPSRFVGVRATIEQSKEAQERLTSEEEELLFGDEAYYEPDPPFPMQHRVKDKFGNILNDPVHRQSPLDYCPSDPLVNKLATMRNQLQNCPELWTELAKYCPDKQALIDEHLCDEKIDLTFEQMSNMVEQSAAVFSALGVTKGVNVAILGENSAKWLLVDHGIQLAGGASAVRGADAPLDELRYIYEHSDSAGIAVLQGPKLLQKLAADAKAKNLNSIGLSNEKHGPVKTIVLMHKEKKSDEDIAKMGKELGMDVVILSDLIAAAKPLDPSRRTKIGKDDLATIVYTSGE